MTRQEVFANYNINKDSIIISPGKFEGEMCYMPHIYDIFLNGDCEEVYDEDDNLEYIVVVPTLEDLKEFPEIESTDEIHFRITDQGFMEEL